MKKRTIQKSMFSMFRYALVCAGICGGILFLAAPVSCKLTEEGVEIVTVDKVVPQILSFDFKQRSMLEIVCSEPMTMKDVLFKKADDENAAANAVTISYNEKKTIAELTLSDPTEIGVRYNLTGIVEDLNGNTLTFSLPFAGYNDCLPVIVFSEIRTEGTGKTPEFVELYVLEGGNTAGLELIGGYDGKEKKYSFPKMEVKTDEYITIHFRHDTDTPENCVDETGKDLTLATVAANNNNCDTARDLWAENEDDSARLQKTDVLMLSADGGNSVLDAVLYSDGTKTDWQKTLSKEFAAKAVSKGIWKSAAIADAASNAGATSTRTLCRQNISVLATKAYERGAIIPTSAADWIVVNTSCATPGLPNSSEAYGN
ncbi:MAG: hypothetical protein IJS09_00465 [Treponema sp.]|nr:hypothetical protein [Treponema sp.]